MWILLTGIALTLVAFVGVPRVTGSHYKLAKLTSLALAAAGFLVARQSIESKERMITARHHEERAICSHLILNIRFSYKTIVETYPNGGPEAEIITASLRGLLGASKFLCFNAPNSCDAAISRLSPDSPSLADDADALMQALDTRSGCSR